MQLIETITVGSGGAASIEFTSIPQDGTDLYYLASLRCTDNGIAARQYFNGDTGSNYRHIFLTGTGSAASSSGSGASPSNYGFVSYLNGSSSTANTFSNVGVYIPNYTASAAKSISVDGVDENNATASRQNIVAANWTGTAGITSILVNVFTGNFAEGSTISLYKITKA